IHVAKAAESTLPPIRAAGELRNPALHFFSPKLRVPPAFWNSANIDDELDPGITDQAGELVGGSGSMPECEKPHRIAFLP
ncbi:MAG TPA: hypothetical protein VIW69_00345, partial [Candidatus Elarobacter sp.]